MNSYCALANGLPADSPDPNKHYHDRLYGFPIEDDNELFGRLLLEINQAGLSWTLILQRAAGLRTAYAGFDIAAVAAFGEADRQRLLADAKVIRNRLKINAAIHNAQQLARPPPPAAAGRLGEAVPPHLQIHRPRNRARIFGEHGLPERRAQRRLPRRRARCRR